MEEMLKNFALFGASGSLISTQSRFTDVPSTTAAPYTTIAASSALPSTSKISTGLLIFIVVLIVVFEILLLVSTYKLTNSGWQTFFCLLFNVIYLVLAFIYYGMAGYKFTKKY